MAVLIDGADYGAGKASRNAPSPRPESGNYHAYNGLRTRCVSIGLPANMTKLRKQDQTTCKLLQVD
ncbi:unnamed protein product [Protopolystoma xenopodis]|uniref:Uncharacterized protein n=1 Tax=Protopolystoma xenopodis TaxID=117903 RepID=A0A3S5FD66_9PLAT|nr:unnamed protein product [Protopolystoma xenopodis]